MGLPTPSPPRLLFIGDRHRGQGVDNPANGGAINGRPVADGRGIGVLCCRGDQPGGGVRDDVGVGLSTLRPRRRSPVNRVAVGAKAALARGWATRHPRRVLNRAMFGPAAASVRRSPTRPRVLNRAMFRPAAASLWAVGQGVDVGLPSTDGRLPTKEGSVVCVAEGSASSWPRDDVGVGFSTLRPRRRSPVNRVAVGEGWATRHPRRVLNRAMFRPAAASLWAAGQGVDVGLPVVRISRRRRCRTAAGATRRCCTDRRRCRPWP